MMDWRVSSFIRSSSSILQTANKAGCLKMDTVNSNIKAAINRLNLQPSMKKKELLTRMQISPHSSPLVRTTKPSPSATKTKDSGICCSDQYTTLHEVWVTTDSHMSHCLVGEVSLPSPFPPSPFSFPSQAPPTTHSDLPASPF